MADAEAVAPVAVALELTTPKAADTQAVEVASASSVSAVQEDTAVPSEAPPQIAQPTDDNDETWRLRITDFEHKRVDDATLRKSKLKGYYKRQNELIDSFVQAEHRIRERQARMAAGLPSPSSIAEQQADDEDAAPAVRFAINISFAANVLLFAIKIFASIYSGSLAVIASAIDSSLDLVSGSIIFIAARLAAKKNLLKYPIGKTRLEPLSIIVFAAVMGMASLQLLRESFQRIMDGLNEGAPVIVIDAVTFGVLGAVIAVKFTLMIICAKLRKNSPSVDALFTDHRNDVVTNTTTIIAVGLASQIPALWPLDAVMAIILALLILFTWANTGKEYITQLTGHVASPEVLSQLTYLAFNHDKRIQLIDTVRAYHFGTKLLAEVDIVLPPTMPLREAHDIGESLQKEIEALDYVERAFVHLDYECSHTAADEHSYPT